MSYLNKLTCCSHLRPILHPALRKKTIRKCIKTLKKYSDQFDSIAVCGYSMALIAPVVADKLNKSLIIVRKDNEHRASWCEAEGEHSTKYIIIDDLIYSGETYTMVVNKIKENLVPDAECVGVYLYCPEVQEMSEEAKELNINFLT